MASLYQYVDEVFRVAQTNNISIAKASEIVKNTHQLKCKSRSLATCTYNRYIHSDRCQLRSKKLSIRSAHKEVWLNEIDALITEGVDALSAIATVAKKHGLITRSCTDIYRKWKNIRVYRERPPTAQIESDILSYLARESVLPNPKHLKRKVLDAFKNKYDQTIILDVATKYIHQKRLQLKEEIVSKVIKHMDATNCTKFEAAQYVAEKENILANKVYNMLGSLKPRKLTEKKKTSLTAKMKHEVYEYIEGLEMQGIGESNAINSAADKYVLNIKDVCKIYHTYSASTIPTRHHPQMIEMYELIKQGTSAVVASSVVGEKYKNSPIFLENIYSKYKNTGALDRLLQKTT